MTETINRLTVVGAKTQVQRFQKSRWDQRLRARHGEWLERSPGRFVCLFETDEPRLRSLRNLSRRWPMLTFLLDYEIEVERTKGLAKAREGQVAHCQFEY